MNTELLFQLYAIHSPSGGEKKMRKFIKRYISKKCGNVKMVQDEKGNLLCTKGVSDTYPCLASHIDQVQHKHSKDFQCVVGNDVVFGYSAKSREQQGLGADDKNGILICLECLQKYDVLKVAFFVEEEVGCRGSRCVDLSFFKDCRFIVQPDRRDGGDLITSMFCGEVCSTEFINAIGYKEYGYKFAVGSITDVGELIDMGVGISCLNLSCGYYEAHTDNEFTVLSELQNCLDFVQHIIETCKDVYPFEQYYDYGYRGHQNHGMTVKEMLRGWGKHSSYTRIDSLPQYETTQRAYGKPSFFDEDDYYESCDYEVDRETMMEHIECMPGISFEEIVNDWGCNFYCKDMLVLREIYDDAICELEFWHGYNDDDDDCEDAVGELSDVKLCKAS